MYERERERERALWGGGGGSLCVWSGGGGRGGDSAHAQAYFNFPAKLSGFSNTVGISEHVNTNNSRQPNFAHNSPRLGSDAVESITSFRRWRAF